MSNHSPFDDNDDLSGLARDLVRELRATTELVVDAAKLGKDELLHYVSENIRSGLSSIDPEHSREASGGRDGAPSRSRTEHRPTYGRERQVSIAKKPKKLKIRQIAKGSVPYFVIGGSFLLVAFILWATLLTNAFYGSFHPELAVVAGSFALAGAFPMRAGRRKVKTEKLYDRYRNAVGSTPRIRLDALATLTKRSYADVLKDVNDMVERGYFGPEATLDAARGILIVDPSAPIREVMEDEEESAPAEPEKSGAGNPSDAYEAMLVELRLLNERIEDEAMSARIYRMEAVARATFLAVREKPEKRSQIQRFMDYYLPTTIKLLGAYADFEKQTVVGENIRSSKKNIEHMMETLSEAYEKQFDSLFRSETMDINAEIRTMDSLLRQDGYVGGFTMPSSSAAAAAEKAE